MPCPDMNYQDKASKVNEIGRELKAQGMVRFGKRAYNQVSDNCFEIASCLAERFGYKPLSRKELHEAIFSERVERSGLWGNMPQSKPKSLACLVIRAPYVPDGFYVPEDTRIHVAFEFKGREYNFECATKEGFPIDFRIPLQRDKRAH